MLDILLIADELSIRSAVSEALQGAGHDVTSASDGAAGLAQLRQRVFDVVISDICLPKIDGLTLFRHVRAESPRTDVILLADVGTVRDAVGAMKEGATDFVLKPVDVDELKIRLERALDRHAIEMELKLSRRALEKESRTNPIIGRSPSMVQVQERIETLAPNDSPVLITGETGTGKDLVARRIHVLSRRRDKPFVTVNCAAFQESMLEAELFGHEQGAFPGATRSGEGRFVSADGGTLFLDEVAEMPMTVQATLLRALKDGAVEPVGSNRSVSFDVRIISATHQDLKKRISERRFREDLYYRLKILDVHLPPLRERQGDLALLIDHILRSSATSDFLPSISPRAWSALTEYAFPGNVRELRHAIERAAVMAGGKEIDLEHLPPEIAGRLSRAVPASEPSRVLFRPLHDAMKEFEREYLRRALVLAEYKKARAAELLAISRKNLWEKLRAHGMSDEEMHEAV